MKKINFKRILSLLLCFMMMPLFFNTDYHAASSTVNNINNVSNINSINNSGVYSFGLKETDENGTAGGNILTTGTLVKRASHHWNGAPDFTGTGTSNDNIKIAITDIEIFTSDTSVIESNSVSWCARIRNGPAEIVDRVHYDNFYSGVELTPVNGIANGINYTDNNIIEIAVYGTGDVFVEVWVTTYGVNTPENEFDRDDRNNYLIKTFILTVVDDSEHDMLDADFLLDANPTPVNITDEIKLAPSSSTSRLAINNVFVYDFDAGQENNGYKVNVPVYTWTAAVTRGNSIELVNENGEPLSGSKSVNGNNSDRFLYIKPSEIEPESNSVNPSIRAGKSTVTVEIINTATSVRKTFEIHFDVSAAVNDFIAESQVLVYNTSDPDKKPVNIPDGIYGYVDITISDLYADVKGVTRNLTDEGSGGIEAKISLARKTSGLNIPFTDPMTTVNEYYNSNGWEVSGNSVKKNIKNILDGNGSGIVQIPYEFLTFIDDTADVQIEISGTFDKYTNDEISVEEIIRTVPIRRISEADNGNFISFGFEAAFDNKEIKDDKGKLSKESTVSNAEIISEIKFETDKDGKYKTGDYSKPLDDLKGKKININGFTADVLDVRNTSALKRTIPDPINSYYGYHNAEYGFKIESITVSPSNTRVIEPVPVISDGMTGDIDVVQEGLDFVLTGTAGMVTVTVKAETNKKIGEPPHEKAVDSIEIRFNIIVENIGVFPESAGNVVSFNLKRENKGKIYFSQTNDGSELKPLYLKPRFETDILASTYDDDEAEKSPSLIINIDEVRITDPAQANTDFTKVLNNFDCLIDVTVGSPGFGDLYFDKTKEKAAVLGSDSFRSVAYSGHGDYLLESNRGKADIKVWTESFAGSRDNYDNSCDANTVIAVTVIPVEIKTGENGEIIREPAASDKWKKVYFRIVVNKLGGEFDLIVDFDGEFIEIERYSENRTGPNIETEMYEFDDTKGIEYMYALRAAADGAKQTAEQWYPVLGSTIDISSLIPKSGNSVFRLAVRKFGDDIVPEEDGNYSSADRRMIELNARRTVSSAERRAVVYDETKGALILSSSKKDSEEALYKVGLSQWASVTLSNETGISALSQYHPLGSTIEIKFKDPYGEKFASASFKIKIPKSAKPPKIKSDKNQTKISGFSNKMSWSVGPEDENDNTWTNDAEKWTKCLKGAISYENLQAIFPGLQEDGDGYYNLYLRTDASGKTFNSAPVIFKIPANKYLGR